MNIKDILERNTVKKVNIYLKNIDEKYEIISLDKTARTAQDAAKSLNVEVGAIVKSLIFKSIDNSFYYLCLTSGDKRISINKLSKINNLEIIKANADEIKEITGFSIGGVPPLAHKNPLKTYLDKSLSRFENLYAAAGHPHAIFKIHFNELFKITKGEIVDIVD